VLFLYISMIILHIRSILLLSTVLQVLFTISCFFHFGIMWHIHFMSLYNYINLFSFLFYCCAGWCTLWCSQRFLEYINYIIPEFTPSTFFFILPSPVPGILSTGIMCAQYFNHTYSSSPFPYLFLPKW
jgi:hypothetical protein